MMFFIFNFRGSTCLQYFMYKFSDAPVEKTNNIRANVYTNAYRGGGGGGGGEG